MFFGGCDPSVQCGSWIRGGKETIGGFRAVTMPLFGMGFLGTSVDCPLCGSIDLIGRGFVGGFEEGNDDEGSAPSEIGPGR